MPFEDASVLCHHIRKVGANLDSVKIEIFELLKDKLNVEGKKVCSEKDNKQMNFFIFNTRLCARIAFISIYKSL